MPPTKNRYSAKKIATGKTRDMTAPAVAAVYAGHGNVLGLMCGELRRRGDPRPRRPAPRAAYAGAPAADAVDRDSLGGAEQASHGVFGDDVSVPVGGAAVE